MKNRRSIMAVSALMILCYHLWAYITNRGTVELFLLTTAYVGVDMFFLLSGYSLGRKDAGAYFKFVWSRFKAVYLKYIIFACVAFIYSGLILGSKKTWNLPRLLKIISSAELFQKGGGAFLWFLPAIMFFYLLFPFFQKCDKRNRWVTLVSVFALWAGIAWEVTSFTNYKAMFIFWNRLPAFFIGFYIQKLDIYIAKRNESAKNTQLRMLQAILGIALAVAGYFILYKWGFRLKLQTPFVDMFYLLGLPLSFGLILLTSFIPEIKPIKWVGSSTLEMYAVQMVFGYNIAKRLIKNVPSVLAANLLCIMVVTAIAVLIHYGYAWIEKKVTKEKSRTTK
ncbi:MAG: acyltransferase [Lachnospiraceae bacterium]|nr:acyltransferase [Lachnospiraceae bacterium]